MALDNVWLVLAFPLLGMVINGLLGRWLPRMAVAVIACTAVAASFVVSVATFLALIRLPGSEQSHISTLFTWIASGSFRADASALIDPLSVFMMLIVTGVGFLIHVYSTGYMADDLRFSRYFTFLNLFTFSMLLLVTASNFLLLFVGWELVGLSSYLLIGFWFERPAAASAGKKAFIVTRIGDFGFTLGIILIFLTFRSLQFGDVFASAGTAGASVLTAITLLLFAGAVGKSAQIPLYVWLPDAMEGPTPVSALIHAATMVTAGVYLVSRCHALFDAVPGVMLLVAVIGAVTAFFAATIALVNNDMKRVLAYSTISQIGYMFLAAGVGAYTAGLFHLMTHAFFKALLFLGAGSVMHAMSGEIDLRKLGGLGSKMPITKWTFMIGALAISGVFPFSGFFSKDEILWGDYSSRQGSLWLYTLGLLTAIMTAFYVFRLVFKTFYGQPKDRRAFDHAHESPPSMSVPLILLAILATAGGLLGLPESLRVFGLGNAIEQFLAPSLKPAGVIVHGGGEVGPHALTLQAIMMIATTALALIAIYAAYYAYVKKPGTAAAIARKLPAVYRLLINKYYVDEIHDFLFVRPGKALAFWLWRVVDVEIIDGAVNGAATSIRYLGSRLRLAETGYVRNYALAMLIGAVALVGYLAVR